MMQKTFLDCCHQFAGHAGVLHPCHFHNRDKSYLETAFAPIGFPCHQGCALRRIDDFFSCQSHLDEISLVSFLPHSEQQEQQTMAASPGMSPWKPRGEASTCQRLFHAAVQVPAAAAAPRAALAAPDGAVRGRRGRGRLPRDYNSHQPPRRRAVRGVQGSSCWRRGLSLGPSGLRNIRSLLAKTYVFYTGKDIHVLLHSTLHNASLLREGSLSVKPHRSCGISSLRFPNACV